MSGGEDWNFDNSATGEHIGNDGTLTGTTTSGDYFAWVDASGNHGATYLLSPFIDVSALTTPALSFFENSHNEGSTNNQLDVEVWDGTAWNNVGIYTTNTMGWEEKWINLNGLTITGDIQIRFTFTEPIDNFQDDIAIDDVQIQELPSCLSPENLSATSLTTTSAVLNWTNATGSTNHNWEVQPQGVAQGTAGVIAQGTDLSGVTANGLAHSTSYDYFVQMNCGGTNSDWVGPYSFTTPPSCYPATALNATAITATSAVLNWTNAIASVDYNWEIQPQGTAQGTAGAISGIGASTGVTANGLTETTDYDFFIQTNCGGGDNSIWVGPISFTTPCSVITPDYNENFTTYLNPCWSEAQGRLSNTNTTMTGTISNWSADGFGNDGTTGSARLNIYSTFTDEWLISPSIDLGTAGNYQLEFDVVLTDYTGTGTDNFGPDDTLAVVISTDNGITWNTANILQSWVAGTEPSNTGDNIIIDLSSYTGVVKFGFYGASTVGNTDYNVYIDNFWVRTPPTCGVPTDLSISNLTTTSVDLNWTDATLGSIVDYNWEIQPQGTAGAISGTGASTGVTANGLTENTNYDVFIQTNCGMGDESVWAGPISFYTGYCVPSSSSASTYVDNFSTTNGSVNISNLNSGFTAGGYFDGSAQIVESYATGTFDFSADIVGGSAGYSIWIDWNNDLIFDDATEKVFNTTSYGNGPFTGTITVPALTALGNYTVRTSVDWNSSNPSNPCNAASRAEFEDYTLTVVAPILVNSITVQGQGGATTIATNAGTLQMEATVLPVNASNGTYTWSVANGTGAATIDAAGLLTASANGDVTVTATANDASGVTGTAVITISNQIILVNSITVQGQGGATTITTNAGTLQMEATVLPADATDGTYTWSVANGTGAATIDAAGLLTASADGDVTVTATANDASGVIGTAVITISNQDVLVASITVQGQGGATTITTNAGTLQMEATVLPANATDGTYTWSVTNGTGAATIDAAGLLTASADGTVTVTATANDPSGLTGDVEITISNQDVLVASIAVQGQGGVSTITLDDGTLQMEATVLPANATDGTYTWSVTNGTGQATIDAAGLLTATHNGDVTVTATANDASGVTGTAVITITNQTALGVNENGGINISLYPNPTQDLVNIVSTETIQSVNIYNIDGKLVLSNTAQNNVVDVKSLASGNYIVVIQTTNGASHKTKIVKQ